MKATLAADADVLPMAQGHVPWAVHSAVRRASVLWGTLGAAALFLVYLAVLALSNSLGHAFDQFLALWHWMTALLIGFGLQVGLFAYARKVTRAAELAHARGVVASGGASTLSMIACCAHHLTDVLSVLGIAGAAVFLATYQGLFLLLGVLSNLVGLVYVLGLLRRHGLYPERPSLLSVALRFPFELALPYAAVLALLVFGAVVVVSAI